MKTALAYPLVLGVVLATIVSSYVIWTFLEDTKVDNRERLDAVIAEFRLAPIQVRQFHEDEKYRLGRALFFDPALSGPRSIACVTCHLLTMVQPTD